MIVVNVVESTATGTLSMVALSSNLLVDAGHDVVVVYSERHDTPKNLKSLFHDNVRLVKCNLQICNFPKSCFELRKVIQQYNPDIVHCHSSIAGFIGRLSAIRFKCKMIYTPHCISFMRKDIGFVKKSLFKFFEFIACIKKSTYLACSLSEKKAIRSSLPFVNIKLIENAVDLKEFSNSYQVNINSSKLKIITVGGIRAQKGALEFAALAKNFKGSNLEFIWIGDGEDSLKQKLIEAGVTVTGWKPRDEVIQELYSADLYLSTALWEGMPVSLIEACAANLPIVARSCAGNVDVVEHKKTGLLFDNTIEATELIEQFFQNPSPYKQYADNAYNTVFERFSVERFSKELIEIYNN
ncbi:glycosyltransferase [Vibrio cyclitrophicus]